MSAGRRIPPIAKALGALVVVVGFAAALRSAIPALVGKRVDVPVTKVTLTSFARTVAVDGILKAVKTTPLIAPASRDALMIAWIAEDGDPVKKGDVVVRFDPEELERKLENGRSDRRAADNRIEKERTLKENTLKERDRGAALVADEIARQEELGKKDPRFFPRSEVIESEIDESLFRSRLDHAQKARAIEEQLAGKKIDLLGVERRKADLFSRQAEEGLSKLEIRAPHDGTFVLRRRDGRAPFRAGDRISPSMRLAELSDDTKMDAEVYVLEADAAGLGQGKLGKVVLDAQPDKTWTGKVSKVAPFPRQLHPEMPAQYFVALLELDGDTAGLKPGQRLRATVVLDEQSHAMVIPRQAVTRRDDDSIVFRKKLTGGFEPVKVKVGTGTPGRIVIREGLQPGDLIALRNPTLSAEEAAAKAGSDEGDGPSGGPRRQKVKKVRP